MSKYVRAKLVCILEFEKEKRGYSMDVRFDQILDCKFQQITKLINSS